MSRESSDSANRRWMDAVKPENWTNPVPKGRYNLVVIGGGTAGLVTAAGAAGLGAKVALIEKSMMGGDCLNTGCVPSKALIRSARAVAAVRDAADFGVSGCQMPRVDFPVVMHRMRELRASLSPHDSAERIRDLGVDVYSGQAQFLDHERVRVEGVDLSFRKCVIATGARAAVPEIPGLEEAGFLTNATVFEIERLPARLAVIGAGPIGCELAQAFARFGSQVVLISKTANVLSREDTAAADILSRAIERDGVRTFFSAAVKRVRCDGSRKVLDVSAPDGTKEIEADEILVGVGRVPNVEHLGLSEAGVDYDSKGILTDDFLRTSNPRIFAAGDVTHYFEFTHAADAMARIAIRNALFGGRARVSSLTIPRCTYTDPEIAQVGITEQEAAIQGVKIKTFVQSLKKVDRAILDGETEGFVKIHVKNGSDRIMGATIVSKHAGETISEITASMVGGIGLKTLANTIHPYPTQAEAIRRIGDAYNRSRFTPMVQSLFRRWLEWTR